MKTKARVAACVAACVMSAPGVAAAQDTGVTVGDGIWSTLGAAVGIVTTVIAIPFMMVSTTGDAVTTSVGGNAQLEMYLKEHEVALRQDLSMGGGETIDDLAWAFGVEPEHRAQFARNLRANRARVLEVGAGDGLDATAFAQTVAALVPR